MKQEVKEAIENLKKSESFLLIARTEDGGGSVTLNSDREHQVKLMLTLPIAFYHCKQLIPYIEQAAKIARAYIDELGEEQPKSIEDMFGFGKVEENERLN